jgi:peptidylprolyl isomerase
MLRRILLLSVATVITLASCSSESPDATASSSSTTTPATTQESTTSTASTPADDSASKPEVVVPDGPPPVELEITDIVEGDGKAAAAGDYLVMHYVGVRHADGGEFDASWNRGDTFSFTLGSSQVIQGWDQGIEGMREGGRRLLSIPADLAYGAEARGELIPANSALVFVVDLLQVATPPEVENAPSPVSELEVVVLDEGDGEVIMAGTIVELHYRAVLQTTGEVFASSWETGQPVVFEVAAEPSQSIPAWDEGLLGRKVGDTVRMVIPPGLGIEDPSGQIPADATIVSELTILDTLN